MRIPAAEGGSPVRECPLPFSPPDIGKEEVDAVVKVLRSGWITRGEQCEEFERRLCEYTGAPHAVVLSSATAGLFLSLKIAGIGEGDEVITTPYTFAATANAVLHTGAVPVLADVAAGGFHLSPEELEKKITPNTRAVIPVHFGGEPAELAEIREIAGRHGILVIEDAAHAIGASYREEKIGSGRNPSVFSFHAVKNLTTAEGGAVTTGDEEIARKLRLYSLHGQTRDAREKLLRRGWRYDIAVPGYKFNMTDLQAALGLVQLGKLDRNREKRRRIAREYDSALRNFDFMRLPAEPPWIIHARHLYPLRIDFSPLRIDRDRFIDALWSENIPVNVHYVPLHLMSFYRKRFGYTPKDFPHSYAAFLEEVSLPIYPGMTLRDISDVQEALVKLLAYYRK